MKIKLVLMPLDNPEKGADDVRAKLNAAFPEFFIGLTRSAYTMTGTELQSTLPIELIQPQIAAMKKLTGKNRAKTEKNLLNTAAMLQKHPLRQGEIIQIISKCFGHGLNDIKKAVKQVRFKILKETLKENASNISNASSTKGAGPGGDSSKRAQPKSIPLPSEGFTTYTKSSEVLYSVLATNGNYYRQGLSLCLARNIGKTHTLHHVQADELRSLAENLGPNLIRMHRGPFGQVQEEPTIMKCDEAKVLLKHSEVEQLSNVRGLVSFPVLTTNGNNPIVQLDGYDAASEILVKPKQELPALPPLQEALAILEQLLKDFQFKTPADKSRAYSMLITMALSTGRVMQELLPMFVIEADQSGSGKGLLVDLMAAIFNQDIALVAKHEGHGAGGQDESFHAALSKGSPLVMFDNWRGKLSSEALEAFMTCRSGLFSIRLPYKEYRGVDPRFYMLTLTSNGCEFTPDQSNRSMLIRLRKQAEDYIFPTFPEGSILEHARANWKTYLAAIYSIASEWIRQGRQQTTISYNGFTGWARCMDWIVQNLLNLPPLLQDIAEEKIRLTSPSRTFLRQLAIAVNEKQRTGEELTATHLVEIAFETGLVIPHYRKGGDDAAAKKGVGMTMASAFGGKDKTTIDVFTVVRGEKRVQRKNGEGGEYISKFYIFNQISRNNPGEKTPVDPTNVPPTSNDPSTGDATSK